jgi:hypothetical protein
LRKNTPPLVIPKPGLSARNLLAASRKTADSSRDNAALRNDKLLWEFSNCTTTDFGVAGQFGNSHGLAGGTFWLLDGASLPLGVGVERILIVGGAALQRCTDGLVPVRL